MMLVNRHKICEITTETVTNKYNHYNEDVNLSKSSKMIASFLKL